jgi:hypothetical protein
MEEEPGPSKKNNNGVNDLMHVSLKQIQMLTTFDK